MAVITSCEEQKEDVIITTTTQDGKVYVTAKSASGGGIWALGYFRQDIEGALFFERHGSISSVARYPKIALEPRSGGKIKVT